MSVKVVNCTKVSVVVPAYNAEATIGATIESVLAQTFTDLEVVVADDGSTDRTAELVSSFPDPRVRLVMAEKNGGEGAARDLAIRHACGDWLAVIDADDCWLPERLENLVSLVPASGDNWMVVDNIMQCYERDEMLIPWRPLWSEQDTPCSFVDFLALPSHLIKPLVPRRVISDLSLHHSDSRFGADAEFFIRAIKLGDLDFIVCPKPMYLYRLTPGSMSAFPGKHALKRDLLLGLTGELEFSEDELAALDCHIDVLDGRIRYEPFLTSVRAGEYGKALRLLLKSPSLMLELAARLPSSLRYRLLLKLKGGNSR